LVGESFWRRIIDFSAMVEFGVISPKDVDLFRYVESAEEAVAWVRDGECVPCGAADGPTL
jgi:hypothetical protein